MKVNFLFGKVPEIILNRGSNFFYEKIVKITLLLLFCPLLVFSQKNHKTIFFSLSGKIMDQKNGCVYLVYNDHNNKRVTDSCLLKNGRFRLKGKISEPTLAFFRLNVKTMVDDGSNTVSFYIEPGHMKAIVNSGRFKEIKMTGSKAQNESEQLEKEINAITKSDSFDLKTAEVQKKFAATHPTSYVSAYTLSLVRYKWPIDTLGTLFSKLDTNIQKSYFGKRVAKHIDEIKNNSIGEIAKHFSATDISGKQISLSDFRGKYVLLNFWASWCKPCRESTPHFIEIFKKYHDFGFEIIAISGDEDINAWKKAVEKDNIEIWYNLLSNQKNDTIKIHDKYAVYSFPTLILIDKNGVIVGRYTGASEEINLDKKLIDVFSEEKF